MAATRLLMRRLRELLRLKYEAGLCPDHQKSSCETFRVCPSLHLRGLWWPSRIRSKDETMSEPFDSQSASLQLSNCSLRAFSLKMACHERT